MLASGLIFLEHLSVPLALEPLLPAARAPEVYRWLARQDDVRVVAEVPSSPYWTERSDALPMYYSTLHWKKTPQGFTGYFPPATNFLRWRLFHFPERESLEFLRRFGVDTLVVTAAEGGRREWERPSADWSFVGPFREGDTVLRLHGADRLVYEPPPAEVDGALEELEPESWRVFASYPHANWARDRLDETAWSTVDEARAGDYYSVRFPEPTAVARISLDVRAPFEFPTRLEVLGHAADGSPVAIPYDAQRAYDALFAALLYRPREARLDLDVETPPLLELRLRIARNDAFLLPWTMAELHLYRRRGAGALAKP